MRAKQSPWSVSCRSIPTIHQHPFQCPGRPLEGKDFDRCKACVHHIRHVGYIFRGHRLELELPVYALELHRILPIKNLRSCQFIDRMEYSVFPRTIGPDVRLEFNAWLTDFPRPLMVYFPSLRVLKFHGSIFSKGPTTLKTQARTTFFSFVLLQAPLPTSKSSSIGTEFNCLTTSLKRSSHLKLCGAWRWKL